MRNLTSINDSFGNSTINHGYLTQLELSLNATSQKVKEITNQIIPILFDETQFHILTEYKLQTNDLVYPRCDLAFSNALAVGYMVNIP